MESWEQEKLKNEKKKPLNESWKETENKEKCSMQIDKLECKTLKMMWRPQNSKSGRDLKTQPGGDHKTNNQVETSKPKNHSRGEAIRRAHSHRRLQNGYNTVQVKENMEDKK